MYKLVALDMDGTLLNKDKKISKENYEAIQKARSMGVKVVLASGRPLKGILRYVKDLNLLDEDDYVIAYNGALVQNTRTGEVISKITMSIGDVEYLYNLSKKLDVNIHALTPDRVIAPRNSKYTQYEADSNDIPLEIVDFNSLDSSTTIVKIMFIDEPEIIDRVVANLPKEVYEKYTVVRSEGFYLEFLDKKVNKGAGVETLAKALGIDKDEVICVGDAGNDIHMIKYAGLGVAMGNAFPEVKKIADYVTRTNEEDGVAHVIKKFILSQAS